MTEPELVADCRRASTGWLCHVVLRDDAGAADYEISVSPAELERFGSGSSSPEELIVASIRFLLEREPRMAILARFELSAIERYFPEYEARIAEYL